ncbi:hypothetical protein C7C45_19275 [Micromonospora arborensis]|uniref:Uncharacterized protein n=1 Tax=Micromonospora arborensis TaxID=2116518 RepID=A0A318P040_9ACTN|nr:hypothetical protein C7C45_19275 [Micromonospora arborensis]
MYRVILGNPLQGIEASKPDWSLIRSELIGGLDVEFRNSFFTRIILNCLLRSLRNLLPAKRQQQAKSTNRAGSNRKPRTGRVYTKAC